jgi:hypothetical protein
MRAGTAAALTLLIAGGGTVGCSSGGGDASADAGADTPPVAVFPAECLATDGVYDVTDDNNQPIQIVIANGHLIGIGGHLCHDPWYGPDIPMVKGGNDNTCTLLNEWCRHSYQCDMAGLCFHSLSVVQEGTSAAHWELTGASNTGCVRHASPWNLGPASCQPICNIGACDGCGGTGCPVPPTLHPLGYPCASASECEAGLTCAAMGSAKKECSERCTTHADCAGLHDAAGTPYRSCHNCTYSIGDNTYTATNICVRGTVCGAGGGTTDACTECLDACRGLSSCCTGVGCICDSDC